MLAVLHLVVPEISIICVNVVVCNARGGVEEITAKLCALSKRFIPHTAHFGNICKPIICYRVLSLCPPLFLLNCVSWGGFLYNFHVEQCIFPC